MTNKYSVKMTERATGEKRNFIIHAQTLEEAQANVDRYIADIGDWEVHSVEFAGESLPK